MSWSRRKFLGRSTVAGLATAGLMPWLPPTEARAEVDGIAKRLILLYHPFGTQYDVWQPAGTATDFSFAGRTVTAPLEPYRSDIVVLDGMRIQWAGMPGDEHQKGMAMLWSGSPPQEGNLFDEASGNAPAGWGSGITIDNHIANELAAGTPFSTLQLGVDVPQKTVRTRMSYLGPASPIDPIQDPNEAFSTLFGEAGATSDELALMKARRLAIVSRTHQEVAALRGRVGSADAMRFEAHLNALDALTTELDALDTACAATPPEMLDAGGSLYLPETGRAQIDVMVQALACGLTNIAGLQIKDEKGNRVDWIDPGISYHELSHSDDDATSGRLTDALVTYTNLFIHLIDRLKATPMPDGQSLFDHSLVVWGSGMATGGHQQSPVPFILSGGCQGELALGRYLRFEEEIRHQRLLVSICQMMGLSDVESFGNVDSGTGPLSALHT